MNKCDLFLLTTNFNYESLMEPVGISVLASIVKNKGFNVTVLEPSIFARSAEECADIIIKANPKIVGFSILIDSHVNDVLKMIKRIRQQCDGVVIFAGGQAITMNYQQKSYYEFIKMLDFFMYGESESVIGKLVTDIIKKNFWYNTPGIGYYRSGKMHINKPAQIVTKLDDLPEMDRSVLKEILEKHPDYHETSVPYGRGCTRNCTFCSEVFSRKSGKPKLRRRSLENVYYEIQKLYNEFGIRSFNIEDESLLDVDNEGKIELLNFLEKISKLSDNIELKILGRIDCISKDLVHALYKGRVSYMFLGVDSVVEDDLILFNKGYTSQEVYKKMDILLKNGYSLEVDSKHRLSTGYIMWHPYSTLAGIRKSFEFLKKYNNTPKLIQHKLMVFSSTPLINKIRADGLLLSENLPEGNFEYPWKFLHNNVDILYEYMEKYYKEWMPIRDGIRTIEKYVSMEKEQCEQRLGGIKTYRKKLDKDFFSYFENILCSVETKNIDNLSNIYLESINELKKYTNFIMKDINNFANSVGFDTDLQEKLKENSLWICRYRN